MTAPARIAIVVPCYNEAARLDTHAFRAFSGQHPEVRFVLVDDGSSDGTVRILEELATEDPAHFDVVALAVNGGKAEAVRSGMLRAFELQAALAGYWDADLATPLDEIPRFVATLEAHPDRDMVFGSRVQLLGRAIERSAARHYLGRIFATAASVMLGLPVYDTQCGAKLFRVTPETQRLFAEPFCVGWTFDVEIVARLVRLRRQSDGPSAEASIYELPLSRWRDVAGSKVRAGDFVVALFEVLRIYRRYLRRGAPPLSAGDPTTAAPSRGRAQPEPGTRAGGEST